MTYGELIAAGALRIFNTAYRAGDDARDRFKSALSRLQESFPAVSGAFIEQFANKAREGVLAANRFQQAGENYQLPRGVAPDFTRTLKDAGFTGPASLLIDARVLQPTVGGGGGPHDFTMRVRVMVPVGSTRAEIEEAVLAAAMRQVSFNAPRYDRFRKNQARSPMVFDRFYSAILAPFNTVY